MRHNRYSQSKLITQPDPWFRQRQRVFMYHYLYQPQFGPPEQWQDLSGTHCQYRGWLHLSNFHRGEIWTYPTQKHRMMVQMLIPPRQLLWKKQFMRLRSERRKDERIHADQISQAIKRNGNFWFFS